MINNAMILAAGFGKRINPLTLKHPKPLLEIGKETLLSNTLKFLELYGFKKVVINVHYLREQIVDYIKNNQFNLSISIVEEKDQVIEGLERSKTEDAEMIKGLERSKTEDAEMIKGLERSVEELKQTINEIYNSSTWKLVSKFTKAQTNME